MARPTRTQLSEHLLQLGGIVDQPYQYRPILYYVCTLALSWAPWFIAVSIQSREGTESTVGLLNLLGLLAPAIVSLSLILGSGNRTLKADLKDRMFSLRRIRPTYLLVAIAMPVVVMVLSIWLSVRLGQPTDQLALSASDNLIGAIVLTMVLAPIIEELGWRGYGVDSLRAKMGMLKTALLFGVLWSLWHAPLVLVHGTYHYELAQMENPLFVTNFFVGVIPAAVVANWLYYRNDRSIIVGVVLHAMLNAAGVLLNAGQVAKTIVTGVYLVIAVGVVLFDREIFADPSPRDFLGQNPGS